jgi:Uma2 family endonuclease
MTTTVDGPKIRRSRKIPSYLVYETINNKPYYYQGYEKVMSGAKKMEEIMGYSSLQSILLNIISTFLYEASQKQLRAVAGEIGLHIATGENPSIDMAVFRKGQLKKEDLIVKYFNIPPAAIIEVDTKATLDSTEIFDYYLIKTQKLLDFGVEEVIWFFTNAKKVLIAKQNQNWITLNWSDDIEILGYPLNFEALYEKEEF